MMITCKETVFLISSGKVKEVSLIKKFKYKFHLKQCPYCKSFDENNKSITRILNINLLNIKGFF
jgi:hypothetical protein